MLSCLHGLSDSQIDGTADLSQRRIPSSMRGVVPAPALLALIVMTILRVLRVSGTHASVSEAEGRVAGLELSGGRATFVLNTEKRIVRGVPKADVWGETC